VKADLDNPPAILLTLTAAAVPAVMAARGQHAGHRFVEFLTANIRKANTRRAYYPSRYDQYIRLAKAASGLKVILVVEQLLPSQASRAH